MSQFIDQVKKDLRALRDIGVPVPDGAFDQADELDGSYENMSVEDAAEMCILLAS